MRSLVVYESWFGNTERLARAIADELASHGDVRLASVEDVTALEDVDLLVVGAPTHVHGMSSAMSRRSALEEIERKGDDPGRGVRGWLKTLPHVDGVRAAAFDTRADKPAALVGSAARGIARRLRRHGFELVSPPQCFFVGGMEGPLEDGALEQATDWARTLAESVDRAALPAV